MITIIIPVWNSTGYLNLCFDALVRQRFKYFEILVIDNFSADTQKINFLISRDKNLNIVFKKNNTNLGFATANNIGANLAQGKWIALLNADAFPEPSWLENLVKAAQENPEYSFFSSRQIQYHQPELLDGAGDAYHISGLAWRHGYNQLAKNQHLENREVFSACGAAALIERDLFLEMGGFDEDYFSYFEDVDLGFRLRLLGKKCLYVPNAVVQHVGSSSTGKRSDFSVYYGYRNMIWTYFKNMPFLLFWIFLPLHITSLMFFVLYLTFRGQGRAIFKAVFDAIRGLPKILIKRKAIQKNIKIKPFELLKVMSIGLFEPYIEFIQRNKK